MSNHIGSSTIYTTILPNNAQLSRIHTVTLSREAKLRLRILEYYFRCRNVTLTCRHYGVARSYLYKWLKRYNSGRLANLENLSRRPKRVRRATYDHDFVSLVRRLRTDYPRYSAKKLAVILRRDFGIVYSAATIGRVIQKFQLYFTRAVRYIRHRRGAQRSWVTRKPYGLTAQQPRQVIEFDMKHIYALSQRYYAFVTVDVVSKEASIRVAKRPSSLQAKRALEAVVERFGTGICVVNDNGSENFGKAYEYLKAQEVTQYFARPHTPKDKPHVENLIGKLQQECLDEARAARSVEELQDQVNRWLNDYHFFRPHQALDYLTPDEYCAKLNLTIPRAKVSTMY